MSATNNTPNKLSNKEKHNRESIDKVINREYENVTKGDLEEPTEEFKRSELNEQSVLMELTDVPRTDELETVGKAFGSVGSVGVALTGKNSKTPEGKAEKAKQGKIVEDEYVLLPDAEKVVEDEGK